MTRAVTKGHAKSGSAPRIDISGKRFGAWVVQEYLSFSHWQCRCDCGTVSSVSHYNLTRGISTRCGCPPHKNVDPRRRSAMYSIWSNMRQRCSNPKATHYARYGGRNIKVCDRWESFDDFYADMGPRPEGKTLDRIDNDGNYEPGNCRWTDKTTQAKNKLTTRWIQVGSETLCLKDWCKRAEVTESSMIYRAKKLGGDYAKAVEFYLQRGGKK